MTKATQPNSIPTPEIDPRVATTTVRVGIDTAAFLAMMMAPIREGEEQADTPEFRKLIKADKKRVIYEMMQTWDMGMAHHVLARAAHTAAYLGGGDICHHANLLWVEIERQCKIPAPTIKELKWKKRESKMRKLSEEAEQVIAADECRLGGAA